MKRKPVVSAFAARKSPRFDSLTQSPISDQERYQEPDMEREEDLKDTDRFSPGPDNHIIKGSSTTYGLMHKETLVFRGIYQITVQKGCILLYGSRFHASKTSYKIYAPSTHALPVIECIPVIDLDLAEETRNDENDKLFENFRAVIHVDSLSSTLLDIPKLVPPFKTLWRSQEQGELEETPIENSSYSLVLQSHFLPLMITPFKSWINFADSFIQRIGKSTEYSPPRILVTGPKSSGKSTFCRFLTNYLLSHDTFPLWYLETDPGQPEYCPPGTLSLHRLNRNDYNFSAPFCHPFNNIIKAQYLGYTSPKDSPSSYLAIISNLFQHYLEERKSSSESPSPLIINTPGWTKGLGQDLLSDILQMTSATHVIYFGTSDGAQNPFSFSVPESLSFNILDPSPSFNPKASADLRALQMMSYMHCSSPRFSAHLTEIAPYRVNLSSIEGIAILASEGIDAEDVELCLVGTIVAIVAVDPEAPINVLPVGENQLPWITPENVEVVLNPDNTELLGLAVVQAIDGRDIRLITPLDTAAVIGKRIVLVRGRLQLPLWEIWKSRAYDSANTPFLSVEGVAGAGSQHWRVRRNVMRRFNN